MENTRKQNHSAQGPLASGAVLSAETQRDSRFQGKPSRDRKQARENKRYGG